MSGAVLWQNDPRWGKETLLDGPGRIGAYGCVLLSLVHAARRWGDRPGLSPVRLNAMAREVGACDRDRLIVHEAAPLVGLEAPLAERVEGTAEKPAPHEDILRAIEKALADPDGGALLRVATDGGTKGRHTILAVGWAPTPPKRVVAADSAPARQPAP